MVVIAIIAVVTVAGSAAFKSMGGGNVKQRAAANQAVAAIDQARSQALASGEDVFLVFATDDTDLGELSYRATALYKRNPNSADGLPLIQDGNWNILPQGVCFYSATPSETPGDILTTSPKDQTFKYGDKDISAPYLLFSSQGAIVSPTIAQTGSGNEASLYIIQGVYKSSGFTPTAKGSTGKPVKDTITVSRYTGRVKHQAYKEN
jgi:type II secretory pathway pseudopilin PulG